MNAWQTKTAALLQAEAWRMDCLRAARLLQLPDWYLAAGSVCRGGGRQGLAAIVAAVADQP